MILASPVQILCGVAHAVDALVAGEMCQHRLFERLVVLCCNCGAATERATRQAHPRLTINLDTTDACTT